jgi:hypothetical protein
MQNKTDFILLQNLPGAQQTSKWLKDSRKVNVQKKVPEVDKVMLNMMYTVFICQCVLIIILLI